MKQLRVLRVVVASPSDVQPERNVLVEVAEELNRGIARDRDLHIDLTRWETDAFPGFHVEGAQGWIDPVLNIEDCELLIGIFWKRFGKPTMDANSGTEHEFRKAYESWKRNKRPQLMIYFKEKSFWPKTREETDQLGKVLDFRQAFPPEGLWWVFTEKPQFEKLVRNHLTQFIRTIPLSDSSQKSLDTPTKTSIKIAPPIEEQIAIWINKVAHSDETRRTYGEYISKLRKVLLEQNLDLNSEDTKAVTGLIEKWAAQASRQATIAASTYNNRISSINSFYSLALNEEWMESIPIPNLKPVNDEEVNSAPPLDPMFVKEALRKIDRTTRGGKREYALLCILFTTGARPAEITNMRCRDVVRTANNVTISTRQKHGKKATYQLEKATAQVLIDYLSSFYGDEYPPDSPVWISFAHNSYGKALGKQSVSDYCQKWLKTTMVESTRQTFLEMKDKVGKSGIENLLGISGVVPTEKSNILL
jgi:site-specific recombinase XerD